MVKDEFVDTPVFLYGRTAAFKPHTDVATNANRALRHPADKPAYSKFHKPMMTSHLRRAMWIMCDCLGFSHTISSKNFCISFAFKSILKDNISG